ncbi:MAG: mechanosensitive ion channel family protein [Desulfobacterales bacterium]|nr:mechanosensitive ion channel family protein [Desulfobacterales bacterium]MBS3754614.1 mechanosensitive ion channel family protein [Desulfobacterales bacterium]
MIERFLASVDFSMLTDKLLGYVPNLIGAILLIILFWVLIKIITKMFTSGLEKTQVAPEVRSLLARFVKYGVMIIAALTVADQLGINVTSLIAGVGIAGLAISFAAQDTIANFISGISLIIDRPFVQGDWISIGDLHATVTDIRLRSTVLTTFDNEVVVVPNTQLAQERVINYTLTPKIRVRVPIGIAYKEDIDRAREVMLSTVQGDSRVMDDPAPMVLVTSLGDSSVNLEMRFWTRDSVMKYSLMWEYIEKVKTALDRSGIEIPFPHMQLFVEQTEAVNALAAGRG